VIRRDVSPESLGLSWASRNFGDSSSARPRESQPFVEQFVEQMSRRLATEAADRWSHPGHELKFAIDDVETPHAG
jgi:hypothetical protein